MKHITHRRRHTCLVVSLIGLMFIGGSGAEETRSNTLPVQIEVEVRLMECVEGMDGLEGKPNGAMTAGPVLESSGLLKRLEAKHAEILTAPRLVTYSGREAKVRDVRECRYPTEFAVRTVSSNGINDSVAVAVPGSFEARGVGTTLKVLPVWDPATHMIDLTFEFDMTSEPVWKDYGSQYVTTNGTAVTLRMEQPFFRTRHFSTSLSVFDNAPLVMGGMIVDGKSLYIVITARTVDEKGNPAKVSNK